MEEVKEFIQKAKEFSEKKEFKNFKILEKELDSMILLVNKIIENLEEL